MSQYYYQAGLQSSMSSRSALGSSSTHHHHGNNHNHRSRRSTRYSSGQNVHKQFKDTSRNQTHKESVEAAQVAAFRKDFEAARSFDLEDDEMFCPWHLLTEDDVSIRFGFDSPDLCPSDTSHQLQSIHSASSDRSSSSGSESPDHSPLQHQLQPTPSFALPPTTHPAMTSASFQPASASHHFKIHAPQAQRTRNAIPIVDPNSRHTSPPNSISPGRQGQKPFYPRRW